jgi:hypothetical protein
MRKYIIKYINEGLYYGGYPYGWCDKILFAETFDTREDAEKFAKGEPDGWYRILEIYIVYN